jgi:hypothetical protein
MQTVGNKLHALRSVSAALKVFAENGYDRMTLPQALFFCAVVEAHLLGQRVTFSEIKDQLGEAINKSLHSTYKTMLVPRGRSNDNGMGWIDAQPNPDDLRERFLILTDKGRALALDIISAYTSSPL